MLVLEGKERGDLDLRFHQSLSPLCEGNPLDLDLGVLGVLLLVLPLIFLSSISSFGGIWERTWALRVPLPLHLVHRFEFSTVIRGSEKLRTLLLLGFCAPRELCASWVLWRPRWLVVPQSSIIVV